MANAVMMFDALGYPRDHPQRVTARRAIDKLLVVKRGRGLLPALPVAGLGHGAGRHALLEAGDARGARRPPARLDWLAARQILDVAGDWAARGPTSGPAAGPFSTPTTTIPMSTTPLSSSGAAPRRPASATHRRSRAPPTGSSALQSRNGGWGAFDADNTYFYLNNIPFADHGALLDPPTADVIGALPRHARPARLAGGTIRRWPRRSPILEREQEPDGSWFGRWGTNYIYGTWSVLCALNAAGVDPRRPRCAARSPG